MVVAESLVESPKNCIKEKRKKSEGADNVHSSDKETRHAKPRQDKTRLEATMKEVGERKPLNCFLCEGPYRV